MQTLDCLAITCQIKFVFAFSLGYFWHLKIWVLVNQKRKQQLNFANQIEYTVVGNIEYKNKPTYITYLQDINLPKANFSLIQTTSDQHIFSNFPTKHQLRTFQNIPISLEILSNKAKAMMYGSQTLMKNLMIIFTIYQPLDFNHLPSMVDQSSNTVIIQIPITVFSS